MGAILKPMIFGPLAIILFLSGLAGADFNFQTQIAALNTPLNPRSIWTFLPTIGALITSGLTIWKLLAKTASPDDVKAVGQQVEGRTLTQAEAAKTRLATADQTAALNGGAHGAFLITDI